MLFKSIFLLSPIVSLPVVSQSLHQPLGHGQLLSLWWTTSLSSVTTNCFERPSPFLGAPPVKAKGIKIINRNISRQSLVKILKLMFGQDGAINAFNHTLIINYDHFCPPGATRLPRILYFLRDLAVAWTGMEFLFFLLPPLRLSVCCSPKVCRAFCKAESLVVGSFFR